MEKSKILLEKIETKKITERYKLDMPEKNPGKFKSKQSVRVKVPKKEDLIGISPATYPDILKMFPKNIDTPSIGNQVPYEDLKTPEMYGINTNLLESENKFDTGCSLFRSNKPKPSYQSKSSTSSLSSLSSFVFLETESSVETLNYDKLAEESDENLEGLRTESHRKLLCDSSEGSCYNQPIYERLASMKDTANDTMIIQDSVTEERPGVGNGHFDEDDIEINSSEISIQMGQDRTLSGSEEEDPIKELREAIEHSTNCLLKCLKSLQNATPRQKKLHLIGNSSMKFDCSTPGCKCSEKDLKDLITKRDDNNSHTSLPISYSLKSKSDPDTKRRLGAVACHSHSPKSIHTDTTKSCDCCGRKCFHFRSTRRQLSNDVLEVNRMLKQKMTISMSQGDFADNLLASDAPVQISRSSYENNNQCFLPTSDLPISARKEMDSVENEIDVSDTSRLIHRSNNGENKQTFQNRSAKSNLIKNEQNEGHRHKKKKKSKAEQICRDCDQGKKHAEDDCKTAARLFLAFLFAIFFGFILFICLYIR